MSKLPEGLCTDCRCAPLVLPVEKATRLCVECLQEQEESGS